MTLSKKMIPYLLICGISYYLLPLITLIASSTYGSTNGWNILFPILIGVIFLPGIFIFYNSSAMIYAPGYAFISLVGMLLGKAFTRAQSS